MTIDLEQDTIEIDGLKNLLSNQIDTTLNIITSFSLVAKNTWIEHIYNKEAEVLLRIYPMQSYVYTNIEKGEEIYSMAYDIEKSDISITDPKGTKTYINLKTMIMEIRVNQATIMDTKDKTLTALTQTKYSGIHIEITNNKTIDAWNWIQNHTTARQITILDHYTGEKISNKQITLTVNGSKTMPDQQFITLKGQINIEITNLWNEKIYHNQTQESKITIPIKTATLTIINNLKNNIEIRIKSTETAKTLSTNMAPETVLSWELNINKTYIVQILNQSREYLINETITTNTTMNKLTIILLITDRQEDIDQENIESITTITLTTTIQNALNTKTNYNIYGITIVAIASTSIAIIAIKKRKNRST